MKRLTSCFAPGLLAALTACGTLSDGQDPAVLAIIQGQLTNTESIDTPSSLRVAVLWQSAQERGGYTVAQEVEVEPVFPSKFKLALTAPPPDGAMLTPGQHYDDGRGAAQGGSTPPGAGGLSPMDGEFDLDDAAFDDMRLGFGFLLAYEDTNGNGKLDLVDEGANAFVDRILGANPEMLVVYAEGNVAHPGLGDEHGGALQRGYNLFKYHECFADGTPADGNPVPEPACTPETAWLPIDSLYDLPITGDPQFSDFMCRDGASSERNEQVLPPDAQPESTDPGPAGYPPAAQISCDADGKAYRHNECTTAIHGPCKGTDTTCTAQYIGLPEGPVPAGWPCAR